MSSSDPSGGGYDGYSEEHITNTASGVINGAILPARGNDTLANAGTINGVILMDWNQDLVTNTGTINGYVGLGTDNDRYEGAGGVVNGIIDGDWGNDVINGGSAADYVIGGRGDDTLNGAAGNDLLLGGFGNDALTGGVGNDGLFGEFGDDHIVTQGGDYVSGGDGDDRIEAGDLTFEYVDGGAGFDTFVMAPGNRIFDLRSALDEHALAGIDQIELKAGQGLVVRPPDVADLSGTTKVFVAGAASNHVYLVGSWTDAGSQTVGGTSYHAYTSGTSTLYVGGGAVATIDATAPAGATGLDPFAGGALAPLPGQDLGVPATDQVETVNGAHILWDETVTVDEIWQSDPTDTDQHAIVVLDGNVTLTNHGTLFASPPVGLARGVFTADATTGVLVNTGTIVALCTTPDTNNYGVAGAVAVRGISRLVNSGTISAVGGNYASAAEVGVFSDTAGLQFSNSGQISAESNTGTATGVTLAPGGSSGEFVRARNDGTISATVHGTPQAAGATGLYIGTLIGGFTNAGTIEAHHDIASSVKSIGIGIGSAEGSDDLPFTITNSGTIRAQIAIQEYSATDSPIKLLNGGDIQGDIDLGRRNDIVDNSHGRITGDIFLAGGDDTFIGAGGTLNGVVHGGLGNDTYTVSDQWTGIQENVGEGTDSVITSASYYLFANFENLTLAAGAGDIFGVGNELANTIQGNEGSNLLIAGAGDDVVHGGDGVDSLFGQDGNDQLFGDAGIDYLVGGNGNDVLDGGTQADALYGEDGNDTLTGGTDFATDILVGGNGNDILHGDSGEGDYDLMDGGSGDDVYYVDTGDDLTFEAAGGGTDTVYANVAGANNGVYLYANVENLVLLGTTTFGVGNELDNHLTGNASANWLLGGAGNDVLNGKAGNDVLFGEAGADTFIFEHGTGGDVIGDFTPGTDKIDLSAFGITDYQAVINSMHEVNGTTAIDLGGGDFIVLNGVANASLHASDFILSGGSQKVEIAAVAPANDGSAGHGALVHEFDAPWLQWKWDGSHDATALA